mmetsp:Transcript_17408/g.52089  ORF Transcript_17408/g.52089 Transcript_17408/m.52089 type:complete len:207 (+) Transcript_17408:2-622(+)
MSAPSDPYQTTRTALHLHPTAIPVHPTAIPPSASLCTFSLMEAARRASANGQVVDAVSAPLARLPMVRRTTSCARKMRAYSASSHAGAKPPSLVAVQVALYGYRSSRAADDLMVFDVPWTAFSSALLRLPFGAVTGVARTGPEAAAIGRDVLVGSHGDGGAPAHTTTWAPAPSSLMPLVCLRDLRSFGNGNVASRRGVYSSARESG